ncbi:hypothetical protein BC629DRAFT_1268145, partial [Irpex lacteus]
MVRNLLFRIPILRAFVPRVSTPILPLSRYAAAEPIVGSLTRQGGRTSSKRLFHHIPARLTNSRSPSPTSSTLPRNASFSQKLKYLITSYGWYALGVYFIIGILDFGVAFAGINVLGAEYVGHIAATAKQFVVSWFPSRPVEPGREGIDSATPATHGGSEGLWAMAVLAYTVHKTLFLPVRVGVTAAVTPRLVGWLRSRGWAGSAGTKRAAQEMRDRYRNSRSSR